MRWSSLVEMTGSNNSAADAVSWYECTGSTCSKGSTAAFMVHIIQKVSKAALLMICMYLCIVITYNRVWINRVRLRNLLVVS